MDDGDCCSTDPYSTRLTGQTGGGHNSIIQLHEHNLLLSSHNGVCFFAFARTRGHSKFAEHGRRYFPWTT